MESLCEAVDHIFISLAELTVHGSIKHWVDAAIEPSEVGSNHVHNSRSPVLSIKDIDQQEGNVADDKEKEDHKTHAGHPTKFSVAILRLAGSGSLRWSHRLRNRRTSTVL